MNIQEFMVRSIRESTEQVFSTMLGEDVHFEDSLIEKGTPEPSDGVVSFIGLAGSWAGTGSLACSPELACYICSQMLMTETTSLNADVLDAVAEITNMVVGCVKTELEHEVGPLGLSIPTVVYGRNFSTKSAGAADWTVVRFTYGGFSLIVKMCLAPSEKPTHLIPHSLGQTCTLEI